MRSMTIATLIVLASWSAATAGQTASSQPVVRVGVFGYKADGGVSLAAWDPQPSTNSVVYIKSLCEVGGGSQGPPARATDAWRFSGKILNISPEEATIELDWQRIVDRGQAVTAPAGSLQLTLRVGEKVILDPVVPNEPSQCAVIDASFEARYDESPIQVIVPGGGRATSGSVSKGQSGGVSSWGGGRLVTVKPRSVSGVKTDRQQLPESAAPLFDVNLWLVHSTPGKPEEVLHQALRAPRAGAPFAFLPLVVDTPHGAMIVQVTGSFAIDTIPSGDDRLVFLTTRRATPARSGPGVRDPPPNSEGRSRITRIMPGPEDVLSFEMPPLLVKGQQTPDTFSIRLRITPR